MIPLQGGAKQPDVVKVLCGNSGADVDWLAEKSDLDLSLVARLGDHSAPRAHHGKERFRGMTISYALIRCWRMSLKKLTVHAITKARAHTRITNPDAGNAWVGLVYVKSGVDAKEYDAVILASGEIGRAHV